MSARKKFQVGQRVRMTQAALDVKLDGMYGRRTGDVRGFSRDDKYVRVYRHGDYYRKVAAYSMDFWEPDESTPPATQAASEREGGCDGPYDCTGEGAS